MRVNVFVALNPARPEPMAFQQYTVVRKGNGPVLLICDTEEETEQVAADIRAEGHETATGLSKESIGCS